MTEWMDLLKSGPSVITACLGVLLGLATKWWRLRETGVRISQRRQQELMKLLHNHVWRKQPALSLQLAIQQAFGKTLDERDFCFIQTRHNPLKLLLDRLTAGPSVRLRDTGDGYEDDRLLRWPSTKATGFAAVFLGALLVFPLFFFVLWAWHTHWLAGMIACAEAVTLLWLSVSVSINMDASARVLSLKHHPAVALPDEASIQQKQVPTPDRPPRSKKVRLAQVPVAPTPPSDAA